MAAPVVSKVNINDLNVFSNNCSDIGHISKYRVSFSSLGN